MAPESPQFLGPNEKKINYNCTSKRQQKWCVRSHKKNKQQHENRIRSRAGRNLYLYGLAEAKSATYRYES